MRLNTLLLASIACAGLAIMPSAHAASEGNAGHSQLSEAAGLAKTIESAPTRSAENRQRDQYRHPLETLSFFGIRPNMTVVEIWPGAGWYTEILAPYLAEQGVYYAAIVPNKYGEATKAKLASDAKAYGKVKQVSFPAAADAPGIPDGSADMVLTFRNVHNWVMSGDEEAAKAFQAMYRMLKPGGILGVVDHRLNEDASDGLEKKSGYLKVSTVKRLAEAAGFRLAGESEINANPKDTKDYPGGVWTLPPSMRGPEAERAQYEAIGESDRMTLRFVKPESRN